MAEITLHNYEAFLLDYSEGNLSAADVIALKAFMVLHPGLDINLEDSALPVIFEEAAPVDFKSDLKKTETDLPDDELLNYLEGQLNASQKIAFEKKAENDAELAGDLAVYKKTILSAETSVVFENKSSLLKTEDAFILNNSVVAYAEGQLTASEKISFEKELAANAALQQEVQLVLKTKLVADATLIYPDKEALKKESRVIALFSFRTVAAMAAAILLLIGLVIVFKGFDSAPVISKEVADKHNAVKEIPVKKEAIQTQNSPAPAANNSTKTYPVQIAATTSAQQQTKHQAANAPVNKQTENRLLSANPSGKNTEMQSNETAKETHTAQAIVHNQQQSEQRHVSNSTVAVIETTTGLPDSSFTKSEINYTQQTIIASVEETDDAEESAAAKNSKKSFWQRAVKMAKRANKLGVKSIDGAENPDHSYSLSFNAFSVEKK